MRHCGTTLVETPPEVVKLLLLLVKELGFPEQDKLYWPRTLVILTVIVAVAFAGKVKPESETLPDPAFAVTVPNVPPPV